MAMHNPPHPGEVLEGLYMEPVGITITALAEHLRVSRKTLSKIVNERGAITPDMALRLSEAFGTTPEIWLNMQQAYDLWAAKEETKTHPHGIRRLAHAG